MHLGSRRNLFKRWALVPICSHARNTLVGFIVSRLAGRYTFLVWDLCYGSKCVYPSWHTDWQVR